MFLAFLETQIVSQCVKIVFLQNFGFTKNEVFEKKIAFFVFVFLSWREREKQKKEKKKGKRKRQKKPIEIVFF